MAKAYSYIRFSTPQQKLGDSLRRQVENTEAYCLAHDLTLDQSMRDEGLSGYHGVHVGAKGALGRFIALVEAGKIETGSVLIVEALDRLSRQEPSLAQEQFLALLNRGVEIVTTVDGQRFSRKSVNQNAGQLFLSLGMMLGNHKESEVKAGRIREGWVARRKGVTNMCPSWIKKVEGRFEIDEPKAAIIRRIYRDVTTMGINAIATALNREGVPLTANRKRERDAWTASAIRQTVRNRNALGEQAVGRYVENKRVETGEVLKDVFPAIISEGEWHAANAAIENRRRGDVTGRHTSKGTFPNLFGSLARCGDCNGYMSIRSNARARSSEFRYLGCSNASVGQCEQRHFHRLDHVETDFLRFMGEMVLAETPKASDPTVPVLAEIADAQAAVVKLEASYQTLFERFGLEPADSPAGKALVNMGDQIKAKQVEIKKLESKLIGLKSTLPPTERMDQLLRLIAGLDGVDGTPLAKLRSQVANAMPSVVRAVKFGFDYVDAPATTGHRRVRVRKTPVPMKPVSRFTVELVSDLPVALMPQSEEGIRLVQAMQAEPDRFMIRDSAVIDTHGPDVLFLDDLDSGEFSAVA